MKVQRYEIYSEDRDCHVYEASLHGQVCITEDVAQLEAAHAELLESVKGFVHMWDNSPIPLGERVIQPLRDAIAKPEGEVMT